MQLIYYIMVQSNPNKLIKYLGAIRVIFGYGTGQTLAGHRFRSLKTESVRTDFRQEVQIILAHRNHFRRQLSIHLKKISEECMSIYFASENAKCAFQI